MNVSRSVFTEHKKFLSRFRPNCQSSVSRALWLDKSRPVTKVCVSAAARTYVISAAQSTTLRVSCRNLSSNMNGSEPWGEEAPAAVADALPHYAQVLSKDLFVKIYMPLPLLGTHCERVWKRVYRAWLSYSQLSR